MSQLYLLILPDNGKLGVGGLRHIGLGPHTNWWYEEKSRTQVLIYWNILIIRYKSGEGGAITFLIRPCLLDLEF